MYRDKEQLMAKTAASSSSTPITSVRTIAPVQIATPYRLVLSKPISWILELLTTGKINTCTQPVDEEI